MSFALAFDVAHVRFGPKGLPQPAQRLPRFAATLGIGLAKDVLPHRGCVICVVEGRNPFGVEVQL